MSPPEVATGLLSLSSVVEEGCDGALPQISFRLGTQAWLFDPDYRSLWGRKVRIRAIHFRHSASGEVVPRQAYIAGVTDIPPFTPFWVKAESLSPMEMPHLALLSLSENIPS